MLSVVRIRGNIAACCEWCKCNMDGMRNAQGDYIWINELEVSGDWQNQDMIKEIIKEIDKKAGNASYVYFMRSKYDKRIRIYPRERFVKFARGQECLA